MRIHLGASRLSPLIKSRLRFCIRVTTSALLAFAVAHLLSIPLHGLWVVLTAVVLTQMSIGGSLQAVAEYVVGTIGGAVYAGAVAALVPQSSALLMALALALAIAPLAYAATLSPSFRVAPFTAVLVLMIASQLGEGPTASAFYRALEVALGGAVALAVSVLVFPARAHSLGLDAAAGVLEKLARALPQLFADVSKEVDPLANQRIQDEIGQAVDAFEAIAAEATRERLISLVTEPDPAVLMRTLLRLRHDLVIIGRSCSEPLSDEIARRIGLPLVRIGVAASDFLLASAAALKSRSSLPPAEPLAGELAAYTAEITAIREAGLTRALPISELERVFALGFALQQFQHDFSDLARCVQDWAARRSEG